MRFRIRENGLGQFKVQRKAWMIGWDDLHVSCSSPGKFSWSDDYGFNSVQLFNSIECARDRIREIKEYYEKEKKRGIWQTVEENDDELFKKLMSLSLDQREEAEAVLKEMGVI